jgi:murein DD-endopeptidase MepM/ murein hydrolase activator NlpD
LQGRATYIIFPNVKKNNTRRATRLRVGLALAAVLTAGWIIPQHILMPVEGATKQSYDQHSFWAYPWGESVTHKGVDIFAKEGTNVHSATDGLVVASGQDRLGGNFVMVLGPQWRLHYYAHLHEIRTHVLAPVSHRSILGTVGNTGDAKGKPTHLHYTIKSVFPCPWRIDHSHQGWKKAFYLNPIPYLNDSFQQPAGSAA